MAAITCHLEEDAPLDSASKKGDENSLELPAAPNVSPDAIPLIMSKLPFLKDKLGLISSCSSWRQAALSRVKELEVQLRINESGCQSLTSAQLAAHIASFQDLTAVKLASGALSECSPELLLALARHSNLKVLRIGTIGSGHDSKVAASTPTSTLHGTTKASVELVQDRAASLFRAFDTLFSSCVKLEELRLNGSKVQRQMQCLLPSQWRKTSANESSGQDSCLLPGVELGLPWCFPRSIQLLSKLRTLHVGPRLFSFHCLSHFSNLPRLERLTVPMDSGKTAHSSLQNLPAITELNLLFDYPFCNASIAVPAAISKLLTLRSLGLFCSGDWRCTGTLCHCSILEVELGKIPPFLKRLTLHGIGRKELPETISVLDSLEELCVQHCPLLEQLPKEVAYLPNLQRLHLSSNQAMSNFFEEESEGGEPTVSYSINEVVVRHCSFLGLTTEPFAKICQHEEFIFSEADEYEGFRLLMSEDLHSTHASDTRNDVVQPM